MSTCLGQDNPAENPQEAIRLDILTDRTLRLELAGLGETLGLAGGASGGDFDFPTSPAVFV